MNEFDINKYVFETLKPLNVPVYFLSRKETQLPLVTFNVTSEIGFDFWDDDEKTTKFKVAINIFSRGNYIDIKNQIVNLMKNRGFTRKDISSCIYQEDVEIFNQPMLFEIIIEKKEVNK